MQELYNCKQIDTEHYKITKFDNHLNPKHDHTGRVSSYTVSEAGCDCPQGHAQSCRHRKMLPFFIEHDYVDTEYFFVWDLHQWYKAPSPVREAREASGRKEPPKPFNEAQELDINELCTAMDAIGIPTVIVDDLTVTDLAPGALDPNFEGGSKPASAVPSPQPSKTYRRF